ncbi:response regulator [Sphingomonas aerophila]|nr:response regulator [Sphingomonas aerophila]
MCHVLIIEDEPMIAMLLQDLLEEAGATSFAFAATEQDAVALAVEHPPRVITSDIQLLEGTGPRAVAEIKSRLGGIPTVFITANPDACDQCRSPDALLTKPINSDQAVRAFEAAISHG